MMTEKKIKTVGRIRFGALIPTVLHRQLKSALAARGENLQDWLIKVATAEVDGIIVFGVGQGGWPEPGSATRQNAAPGLKPLASGRPGA